MPEIKTFIYGSVALLLLFIIASTLFLPYFATTYEHGFGDEPCMKDGCDGTDTGDTQYNPYCVRTAGTEIACANCNITAGYEFFLANCWKLSPANASEIQRSEPDAWQNNTYCYQCADFGTKSSIRGLTLLVLVLGIISFAFISVKIIRDKL